MSYKKRLVTFPYDVGYKNNSDSRFYGACKGGDTILNKSGEGYNSTFTLPAEGGGTHTMPSTSEGVLYNVNSGCFHRASISGNPETELFYDIYSKSNSTCWKKTFSVGDVNWGNNYNNINSSWAYDVTGYWGKIRGQNNSSDADCSGQLDSLVGAYIKPNGDRAYIWYPQQRGVYSYGSPLRRGDAEHIFGFQASSSDCNKIINGGWRFWRLYVAVSICRNGSGKNTTRSTVSMWSFTPQFGTNTSSWNGSHGHKKILVPKLTTWTKRSTLSTEVPFMHV